MEAAGTGALSKVMSVQLQKGILNAGNGNDTTGTPWTLFSSDLEASQCAGLASRFSSSWNTHLLRLNYLLSSISLIVRKESR